MRKRVVEAREVQRLRFNEDGVYCNAQMSTKQTRDWCALDEYLIAYMAEPSHAATVRASSFAATLELVREGLLEMNQQKAFAPLYVRKRQGDGVSSVSNDVVESGNG